MWKCEICGRKFEKSDQHHFCRPLSAIDDYIAAQDEHKREALQKVREVINAAAPEAIEKLSWQMPTFWQGENLVHFAASKNHLGLYPGGEASEAFSERLDSADISYDKGTIRFRWNEPIDYDLIADIVKWRVAQVQTKE